MKILHTATDRSVANTQTMVFAHAFPGARIVAALNESEVSRACVDNEIDLFIINANLPTRSKLLFEAAVRVSCPKAKLVEIFYFAPETHAEVTISSVQGTAELVRILKETMAVNGTAKSATQ